MMERWIRQAFAIAALGVFMATHAGAKDVPGRMVFVDAHAHATLKSATGTLDAMRKMGIERTIVMAPPVAPSQKIRISEYGYRDAARKFPDKFVFFGGGASLNKMVHEAAQAGRTSDSLTKKFQKTAKKLLKDGAKGFGEIAAEHVSLRKGHPYMSTPPDHPLFLLLADIAGNAGVPIDFHMEAVTHDIATPAHFAGPPNPEKLTANIAPFERLLAHNRKTTIIWAHAGWGNTGHRTAELRARLLAAHPNLFMSIKMEKKGQPITNLLDESRRLKPEWLDLFTQFPDRFILGSDEKYDKNRGKGGKNTRGIRKLLGQLPPGIAKKFAQDNPRRLFGLNF